MDNDVQCQIPQFQNPLCSLRFALCFSQIPSAPCSMFIPPAPRYLFLRRQKIGTHAPFLQVESDIRAEIALHPLILTEDVVCVAREIVSG
jgi:hypothetical protein